MKQVFLSVIFTLFGIQSASAIDSVDYGRFIILAAWSSLGEDLRLQNSSGKSPYTDFEQDKIAKPMYYIWSAAYDKDLLEFRDGSDPIFITKNGEPPRTAVTNKQPLSKIVFNLSIVNDPQKFTFANAIQLLVHELGHKIERSGSDHSVSQDQVDTVAGKLALLNNPLEMLTAFRGPDDSEMQFVNINTNSRIYYGDEYPSDRRGKFVFITPPMGILWGKKFYPLSQFFLEKYTREVPEPSWNHFFKEFFVENVIVYEPESGAAEFEFVVTARREKCEKKKGEDEYFCAKAFVEFDGAIGLRIVKDLLEVKPNKMIVNDSFPTYVVRKFYLQKEPDEKVLKILGYADFRGLPPEIGVPYDPELIFDLGGERLKVPIKIIGGIQDRYSFKTLTFSAEIPKKKIRERKARFVGLLLSDRSDPFFQDKLLVPSMEYRF